METTYRNVCEGIVPNNLCIGCGICSGICPPQVLKMQFNRYGEYVPTEFKEGCLPKCDLCLRACPFFDQEDNENTLASAAFGNEDQIIHRTETGYYLATFSGYSLRKGQRLNAASGGLATWFLQSLLENSSVDRVVCVVPNDNPDKLFRFTVLDSADDISKSAKSCYYPVEMSEVIREILQVDARYAVVGLPCFLKSLRLAMRTNRRLRRRIVVLAGLVCGQTKSKFFAEYLCALGGGAPAMMSQARFRIKDLEQPANNFGFSFECSGGNVQSGTVFWKEGMGEAWSLGYFKPNACNYCDDIFAEVADVVFMDAWLECNIHDPRGTSHALIRKASVLKVFEKGIQNGSVYLEEISIEDVIQGRQGVIKIKRSGLAERLKMAQIFRWKAVTQKRVNPTGLSLYRICHLWLEHLLVSVSNLAFLKQRESSGLDYFWRRVGPVLFLIRVLNYAQFRFSRKR